MQNKPYSSNKIQYLGNDSASRRRLTSINTFYWTLGWFSVKFLTSKCIIGRWYSIIRLALTHAWDNSYNFTRGRIENLPFHEKNTYMWCHVWQRKKQYPKLVAAVQQNYKQTHAQSWQTSIVSPSCASTHFPSIRPWVFNRPELVSFETRFSLFMLICHKNINKF